MKLKVNGQWRQVQHEDELLLWVLRDELGLTGTHYGCGIGMCGSCTVLIDGVATRSCLTPVKNVVGKAVTTLEGLAKRDKEGEVKWHPVQQAFLENPLQCGWCLPGHLMSAVELVNQNDQPTEEQIEESAKKNLCRCGGYNAVRRAVARAAELKREKS